MAEWRLGSYQLQRKLGEGGMAQVYLARDVRLRRDVAVKVLDRKLADRPGFRERFMREARLAAALDHPNIVPLYDFGDEEALFLVMPFVSGGSLQDMLPRTPLQVGEVVTYGSQIADALDYAHQRKVVHRDVKPANMLIHADGRLMLSDFGLAKIVSQTNMMNAPRNRPDAGTPEYMAPEQVVGSSDARSDIYGLGVVLYLLLTGRLPFTGSSSHEVMQAHLRDEPAPPRRYNPAIPAAMEVVVMRAMAKQPADRFQRASELGAALLGALIAGDGTTPRSFASAPSRGGSLPTGPSAAVRPPDGARTSDRPGGGPPPWRQRASGSSGQPSPPAHGLTSIPPSGFPERPHPSSIGGLLPDLNVPFTSHVESNLPGASGGYHPSGEGARSGNWNSFASSQVTTGGHGAGGTLLSGRMNSLPPQSPIQRQSGFSQAQHSLPGEETRILAQPLAGVRATMAPAPFQVQPPDAAALRAALPGSRLSDPPYLPPQPPARSSRLWVVIAILLIIMLFAAVALLRYYQILQSAALH
ncbi:MAG TPA: protein kinase [Ktedonobacterales bacterium]|nr:protein kinase [Ktedonobacterales bacterium]